MINTRDNSSGTNIEKRSILITMYFLMSIILYNVIEKNATSVEREAAVRPTILINIRLVIILMVAQ